MLEGRYAYSCGMSVNSDVIDLSLMDFSETILAKSDVSLRERTMAQALNMVCDWLRGDRLRSGFPTRHFLEWNSYVHLQAAWPRLFVPPIMAGPA